MIERPRRLRSSVNIRSLVQETTLSLKQLIQPYFLAESPTSEESIPGFTGVSRLGVDPLTRRIEGDLERGLKSFLLFAKARQKDALASESASLEAVLPEAVAVLRKRLGNEFLLFSDVCLCPYTDTGHCGFVKEKRVDNDASVQALARMAVAHAQSGVDFVAPSDMMDGRVAAIRKALDGAGFSDVGVLAYTAKYASAYYGPFREALDSSPQEFNRASYQMDFGNAREAMRELSLDLAEGADLVMVKPALAYLDIIHRFSLESKVPVVAYSVSGEYEATLRLAQAGLADERDLAVENLIAIRRAGAQAVITYFASKAAHERWI